MVGQTDVLDVFAPALKIGGEKGGNEVHPNKIFPEIERRHSHQDKNPDYYREGELSPDAPANTFVPNRRGITDKRPNKNKWSKKKTKIQLEKGSDAPSPAWTRCLAKRPEFVILLRRKMVVVGLMHLSIEAKAHQAECADYDSVELIKTAVFSE